MKSINPLEDLKEIRKMMETSTKFLSLSGLSGISAGLIALIGSGVAWKLIKNFEHKSPLYYLTNRFDQELFNLGLDLLGLALSILVLAVSFGFLFTYRTAKKTKQKLLSPISFKLFWSLGTPLAFGGVFTLLMLKNGVYSMIPASTLIFYGLSLLNASKYVHVEIKYLALCQLFLGLLSAYLTPSNYYYSLYIWAFGFGVLHIIYGTIMYIKYDKKQK
jgi:hypothetical protein